MRNAPILVEVALGRVEKETCVSVPGFHGYTKNDLEMLRMEGINPIWGGDGTDPANPDPVPPPANPGNSPPDPMASIARSLETLTERQTKTEADIEDAVARAVAKLAEPGTNKQTVVVDPPANIVISDRFDQLGYTRGDFEVAMMLFEGMGKIRTMPKALTPPPDLVRAWAHHTFGAGNGGRVPVQLLDDTGKKTRQLEAPDIDPDTGYIRAMDAATTGFGLELIGAQYVHDLWTAARNNDGLVGRIREVPMTDPTMYVPIDGDLPEMLFVADQPNDNAAYTSPYATSRTGSNRASMTAKKFTIQEIWTGELSEDSIVAWTPFLRERLNMSASLYLGSSMLNGDTATGANVNVSLGDGTPGATKHYLAYDGIRKYSIVTATAQGKDMAGALDPKELQRMRGKLNGGDDDVDNLIKNINWGLNAGNLMMVMDWDSYMTMLDLDDVATVDKYGAGATIMTGELARWKGIPIVVPSYAVKTLATGKYSDTEASNTKGQINLVAPSGWLAGNRRDLQLFFDRIQRTDQFLFELYCRRGFTRFGGNVAASIFDITV